MAESSMTSGSNATRVGSYKHSQFSMNY